MFDLIFWGLVGLIALAGAVSTVVTLLAFWLYVTERDHES